MKTKAAPSVHDSCGHEHFGVCAPARFISSQSSRRSDKAPSRRDSALGDSLALCARIPFDFDECKDIQATEPTRSCDSAGRDLDGITHSALVARIDRILERTASSIPGRETHRSRYMTPAFTPSAARAACGLWSADRDFSRMRGLHIVNPCLE